MDNKIIQKYYDSSESQKKQIIEYLYDISEFKSFDDFKTILHSMVEIDDYQEYYNDRILSLIQQVYIEGIYENDKIKSFVNDLFKNIIELGNKYTFYYALYQNFKHIDNYLFPITENDLKNICFERLNIFVDSKAQEIDACYNLYYLCRDHVDEKNNVVLQARAHKVFRKYIDIYPWDYIDSLIRPYGVPIYPASAGFTIEPFVEHTFNGWKNFMEFIDNLYEMMKGDDRSERFKKYIEFFLKFEERKYKPFIVPKKDWPLYAIDELISERGWPVA